MLIILGDFNIHFLDTRGFSYERVVDILETFDFVQHIYIYIYIYICQHIPVAIYLII